MVGWSICAAEILNCAHVRNGSKPEKLYASICFPLYPPKRTQVGHRVRSEMCQYRKSRPTRSNRWCCETGIAKARTVERRCVILEVLLCGGRQYTTGARRFAINLYAIPIQKCENRVRVRADRPLPPLPLFCIRDEPGPTQGSDEPSN